MNATARNIRRIAKPRSTTPTTSDAPTAKRGRPRASTNGNGTKHAGDLLPLDLPNGSTVHLAASDLGKLASYGLTQMVKQAAKPARPVIVAKPTRKPGSARKRQASAPAAVALAA